MTSSRNGRLGCAGGSVSRTRLAFPLTPVSRLLKSCATPPASTPMLSSFCVCRICSSRRFRSRNCPIWLPITSSNCRSWVSGSRISELKNSMIARTSEPSSMGKPKAACNLSRTANGARGKLVSLVTSGIHAALADCQTRPGRPTPILNLHSRQWS